MSDFDHAFTSGVLDPEEVALLQDICSRIFAEPWFSKDSRRRETFASFVFHMYRRGMVQPDRLEALCRAAAKAHYMSDEGLVLPEAGLAGNHILVVEDEALLARDILRRLAATGATVVGPVGTVGDALDLLEDNTPLDGALLDIALHGEMVYPVAAALRTRNVPFAFVSGQERPDVPPDFRNVAVFPKPADWTKVAAYLIDSRNSV